MQTTHFGFEEIPAEEKQARVRHVFDRVAARYDIMNDAMSIGLHRAWKEQFVTRLQPRDSMRLLDVAGGTGDIAFRALKRAPGMQVTLLDINAAMLAQGRDRAIDRNLLQGIEWVCGNAEKLPLPDAQFDAYTVAFGIRNVTDIPQALREAYRVLKPGGHFLCLEFSRVENALLSRLYDAYSFHVIPRLGSLLAGDGEPYRYLVESIRRFPPPQEFSRMIEAAGFVRVTHKPLTGGAVAIHSGWKI